MNNTSNEQTKPVITRSNARILELEKSIVNFTKYIKDNQEEIERIKLIASSLDAIPEIGKEIKLYTRAIYIDVDGDHKDVISAIKFFGGRWLKYFNEYDGSVSYYRKDKWLDIYSVQLINAKPAASCKLIKYESVEVEKRTKYKMVCGSKVNVSE